MAHLCTRVSRQLALAALAFSASLSTALAQAMPAPNAQTIAAQWETYSQSEVASVVEFAPMRAVQERTFGDGMTLRLTALHRDMNSWVLLETIPAEGQGRAQSYHFENADPEVWRFALGDGDLPSLQVSGPGDPLACTPWADDPSELDEAAASGLPYAPVCGGRLYLRNRVSGSRTNREAVSEFLRKNVVFGDKLVNLIKGAFFEDAFLETASLGADGDDTGDVVAALGTADLERRPVMRPYMGLDVAGADAGMEAGAWYALNDVAGVYTSVVQPGLVSQALLRSGGGANWLDAVERNADTYLVAFDLSEFELGYELGTDHPGLGWSSRPPRRSGEWNLPGPDGFGKPVPLVRNGMLSPALTGRVVAAFAGGFKRDHGAFRAGDLSRSNRGHHYGFITNGVTFSRLVENLSTLYVLDDGTVDLKIWEETDNALIPRVRFARQNGVPLVLRNAETGAVEIGSRVQSWGGGNWSGSAEAQLRTLRAGACIRDTGGRKFLIYGYFSSVTPSGMARVFQAYDCDHALQLDMNSPELTYLAVYRQNQDGNGLEAMHLSRFMAESDPWVRGARVPRFVTFSDNRDFFYLLRKE